MRGVWRIPPGVPPANWTVMEDPAAAAGYRQEIAGHALCRVDEAILKALFPPLASATAPVVADLGCGTGRAALLLAGRGYRILAVDLSWSMLRATVQQSRTAGLPVQGLRANLAQLDMLRDSTADHAICLFNTLGMIGPRRWRLAALQHVRRILRPRGTLLLHVHNAWHLLAFPGGWRRLVAQYLLQALGRGTEPGDGWMEGGPGGPRYVHAFPWHEIAGALRRAGFAVRKIYPLAPGAQGILRQGWWNSRVRAYGWLLVCQAEPET